MATGSLVDGALRAQIAQLSRDPFADVLAKLLGVKLSPEALQAFADKSPDRWAQAVSIIARPAGYNDKLEIKHSGGLVAFAMNLDAMSDAQLEASRDQIARELGVMRSPDASPPKALPLPLESTQQPGDTTPNAQ